MSPPDSAFGRIRPQPGTRPVTPTEAWSVLAAGNARFMADARLHPNQDIGLRHKIAGRQRPFAVFFGCGDSRVAAEIIFDQGLGDLFVVRTAGHVVDSSVLGSMEFGIGILGIPLIVVLGHDSCGAVGAALEALETGAMPGGYVRDIVERVLPSVLATRQRGQTSAEQVEAEHVRQTARLLTERSMLIAERIEQGRLGIIGANYALRDGAARVISAIGVSVPE